MPRSNTVARVSKPAKVAIKKAIGSLTSVITREPVAALTFDDGPHPEYTPRVAAVLKRYDARATFFMVGQAAEKRPDLVKAIGEAGHSIGVHSWEHSSFRLMTGRERRQQIRACARVLAPYAQRLVRPPYGEQSVAARLDAFWLGYEVVSWNVDVGDWFEPDAALMSNRLVESIRPGSMVLLHDALFDHGTPHRGPKLERPAHVNRESMLEALERALAHLHGRFRFVTVPELIQCGTPHRVLWFKKAEY